MKVGGWWVVVGGAAAAALALVLVEAGLQVGLGAQNRATQVPLFEPDPLWAQALPNKWATGAVGGIAVDSHDNVWVFQRPATIPESERGASLNPPASECCIPAPSVLEFSPDGRLLQAWGKPGAGYEWFKTEHGIFVDDKDNVWLSGSAKEDNQILKFTRDGKFLMQIGHAGKNKGSDDTENVGGPASLFIYKKTNELFVADGYFNHRVVVFDAETGKFKRAWGAYGKKPDDSYKFPPRAQLIAGDPPPQFNNPVHAALVSNDDLVYVADRTNNRLQIFKVDGTFVKEVFVARNTLQQEGTVYNFVFSPDKEQRFLYVMDGSNKAIRVYDRKSMEIVENIGGHAGHNAREFFHPHSFAVDSKGNLFIGEVNDGQRYYRYAFKGMGPAPSTQLLTTDHYVRVTSTVPAIAGQPAQLYVRERVLAGRAPASNDNVVLFVHGAGTPAEVAFDVPYQDYSWMAFLAQAGLDVFSVDMTGYGRSTRPAPMNDPCNLSKEQQAGIVSAPCAPTYPHTLTSMVSDWDDVAAAVDYIRALRHVDRVSLVAWSRGGPRAGGYAAQHPEKVKRLVVLAPAYDRMTRPDAATRTLGDGVPMNKQSHNDFIANWDRQVGCATQYEPAAAEAIWTDMMASDPVGAKWGPGVRRAPETVGSWTPEMAKRLTVPFLMVSGAHDKQVAPDRVRELYADAGSSEKVFVDLACSSHNAMWERNHLLLFRASLEWLTKGTVDGTKSGMLKVGYEPARATR